MLSPQGPQRSRHSVARVDVAAIVHPHCNGYISGKCGEIRNSLSLSGEKWRRSRHLVFWSLGTLTGLRNWVRRLVA
jgi:hypothetical protein